jgi:wyosine [tRNA(Phe)-imidazoG37] synthetase (radical SAM superfamily)
VTPVPKILERPSAERAGNVAGHGDRILASSIIYGPVPSWRLGRSLGIDLISTKGKTCSFDCIYCQLGKTVHPEVERKEFVSLDRLAQELKSVAGIAADYVTFSGVGEPSLASNLAEAIRLVRSALNLPVAVLTNSSLVSREDVRQELSLADVVVAKVDAPSEELFGKINRPFGKQTLAEILKALLLFRKEYQGKLALQMMFVEANDSHAAEMAKIAEQLLTDEVQLNTPLRPCAVTPLGTQQMAIIRAAFSGIRNVVTVYEAYKPEVTPLNQAETWLRRPIEERFAREAPSRKSGHGDGTTRGCNSRKNGSRAED